MKNYDETVRINHNPKWSYMADHAYRILIIGGSWSGKTNVLVNLIKLQQSDIDKIYLSVKDPLESKYQLLFKRREKVATGTVKNPTDYSRKIDVYEI